MPQKLIGVACNITSTRSNNTAEAGAHPEGVIAAVIGTRGIEYECVLSAQFIGDGVEHLFNLTTAVYQTFRQQERASPAVFRQCAKDMQVHLVAFVLRSARAFRGKQGSQRAGSENVEVFRVSETGNAYGIDQHIGLSNRLQDVLKLRRACGVLSIRNEQNRAFRVAAAMNLGERVDQRIVESRAAGRVQVAERL